MERPDSFEWTSIFPEHAAAARRALPVEPPSAVTTIQSQSPSTARPHSRCSPDCPDPLARKVLRELPERKAPQDRSDLRAPRAQLEPLARPDRKVRLAPPD